MCFFFFCVLAFKQNKVKRLKRTPLNSIILPRPPVPRPQNHVCLPQRERTQSDFWKWTAQKNQFSETFLTSRHRGELRIAVHICIIKNITTALRPARLNTTHSCPQIMHLILHNLVPWEPPGVCKSWLTPTCGGASSWKCVFQTTLPSAIVFHKPINNWSHLSWKEVSSQRPVALPYVDILNSLKETQ